MLCVLSPEMIFGVSAGCAIANVLGVMMGMNQIGMIDALIGTMATLLAGLASYALRKARVKNIPWLSALMPVLFNSVIIGAELGWIIGGKDAFWSMFGIFALEVGIGEAIAVFALGIPLAMYMEKTRIIQRISNIHPEE